MISAKFEPKLLLPAPGTQPDTYDCSKGMTPPNDFIVSRTVDGSVASHYGNLSWDWTAYDTGRRSSWLNFRFWKDDKEKLNQSRVRLVDEMHWLLFLLIWKREGLPLSYQSLCNYLTNLRRIAVYCESHSCSISDVLTDHVRVIDFLNNAGNVNFNSLSALLSLLRKLGSDETGLRDPCPRSITELQRRVQTYAESTKQHSPIPTRIYSELIARLKSELDAFERVADPFLSLFAECAYDPLTGRTKASQAGIARRLGLKEWAYRPEFPELLHKYGLEEYFFQNGRSLCLAEMTRVIWEIQHAARLTIHVFSGMRDDEVRYLPFHCKETSSSSGKKHYLIVGRTRKLNNGRYKRVRWVTNREGFRAIEIVQRIAIVIFRVHGKRPEKGSSQINAYPLFVSPAHLAFSGKAYPAVNDTFWPIRAKLGSATHLLTRLLPSIEANDIRELEQIDPHRAWSAEKKYQIGQRWPLTTHQLRRSLALYAQRSGLVSLPSLRRQLQHITQEMAQYYAKGAAFAKKLVGGDEEHFANEWQRTQPVSSAISYLVNVIYSEDKLFGGHGNYVEHRLRRSVFVVDREAIMLRFKRGELAYTENVLDEAATRRNRLLLQHELFCTSAPLFPRG
jgi:hypothetical protein